MCLVLIRYPCDNLSRSIEIHHRGTRIRRLVYVTTCDVSVTRSNGCHVALCWLPNSRVTDTNTGCRRERKFTKRGRGVSREGGGTGRTGHHAARLTGPFPRRHGQVILPLFGGRGRTCNFMRRQRIPDPLSSLKRGRRSGISCGKSFVITVGS